jgi:hypothetical protein
MPYLPSTQSMDGFYGTFYKETKKMKQGFIFLVESLPQHLKKKRKHSIPSVSSQNCHHRPLNK